MVQIVSDRMKKMVTAEGGTLAQVEGARPMIGWEGRYSRPGWTTDMFIDAIFPEFVKTPAAPAGRGGQR